MLYMAGTTHNITANPASSAPLSRTEQAHGRIRLEILTFGLLPGEMISEVSLANRFDLSIAAVRAALPRLRQDGLLINKKRWGQMVCPITIEDIEHTYELRSLLEPLAAKKAVKNLDAGRLRQLDEKVSAGQLFGDRESGVDAIFAHREFHIAIATACGNSQLAKWISELLDKVVRFQYLDLRHSEARGISWQDCHQDIITAFENGDPQQAVEAMQADVNGGRELVLQAITNLPEFRKLNLGGADSRDVAG